MVVRLFPSMKAAALLERFRVNIMRYIIDRVNRAAAVDKL